jgi:cell division protein FtsL
MTRGQSIAVAGLFAAVVVSGVAVVYAKNTSRALFVELQQVRHAKDDADREWGKLQLELATRGALNRVMSIASERLEMQAPSAQDIAVVR